MDALLEWGVDVVLWFQQFSPGLDGIFKFFTFLGETEFYLILLPLVYWSVDRATGVRLMVISLTSSLVNTVAKDLGGQPRPFTYDDQVIGIADADGYGLPSGHTQNAVVIWGFLASEAKRRWAWFLALTLVTGVGLSRIYLGVHFPTDVLGGLMVGSLILLIWNKYGGHLEKWFCRLSILAQMAAVATFPLIVMVAFPTEDAVTAGSTFVGMGAGIILERRHLHFTTLGSVAMRAARFLAGGMILVAIWWTLRQLFGEIEPALLFRAVRYSIVGFWGAFGAPWFFLRIGLAHQQPELVSD